jgi:hypothetical protein
MRKLIEHYCCRDDLATYDPYDIWKTWYGLPVKKLYNRNRIVGLIPAAVLTFFDTFLNNTLRKSYDAQEYPIVRAFAALALLNLYRSQGGFLYLSHSERHLRWLAEHPCAGYTGYSWGIGFTNAVSRDIVYASNTPFTTITPYALEAFVEHVRVTGDRQFMPVIKGIYDYFEEEIKVMEETDDHLATSYGPLRDRIAINAVSYTMFSYALLLQYIPEDKKVAAREKIRKLYSYIRKNQNQDGSWFYSPQGNSFIDCFHSCIILKNLIKTDRLIALPECSWISEKGYAYLKDTLFDRQNRLFRRFSVKNKPSIVRFDLYDNAEMLNLAWLRDDRELVDSLSESIKAHFCRGDDIYSQIVEPGILRNKNMLRWAVMPYLYALSQIGSNGGRL